MMYIVISILKGFFSTELIYQMIQLSSVDSLNWRAIAKQPTDIVAFCFGISENTVFSNAIDSVSFGRTGGTKYVLP
jgi:hypothetical protein